MSQFPAQALCAAMVLACWGVPKSPCLSSRRPKFQVLAYSNSTRSLRRTMLW